MAYLDLLVSLVFLDPEVLVETKESVDLQEKGEREDLLDHQERALAMMLQHWLLS